MTITDFKIYYKVIVTKTAQYLCQSKHVDQWKRKGNSKINSHIYSQLIFNKVTTNLQWGQDSLFHKRYI